MNPGNLYIDAAYILFTIAYNEIGVYAILLRLGSKKSIFEHPNRIMYLRYNTYVQDTKAIWTC